MNAPQKSVLLAPPLDEDEDEDDEFLTQAEQSAVDTVCRPAHSLGDESSRFQQILAVLRGLAPYARRHLRWFGGGTCAAFGVVAAKLALPWPLRAVTDIWKDGGDTLALIAPYMDPVIAMGIAFLMLGFALGLFDMLERLCFARFALATVKDLRADAMAHAVANRLSNRGDLVARFVGDSSRVSAGIQSFLVHVGTSLILLIGMTIILFNMEAMLGLIFTAAGALTLLITGYIARKIFISSLKTRKRAGKLANRLYAAIHEESSDPAAFQRGEHSAKANHTRLQGIATWSAHAIFGAAVLVALYVGSDAVAQGRMATGDMVVFMMYALMLQSPTVRLARQGAKCGKIFGSAYRLMQISHLRGRP